MSLSEEEKREFDADAQETQLNEQLNVPTETVEDIEEHTDMQDEKTASPNVEPPEMSVPKNPAVGNFPQYPYPPMPGFMNPFVAPYMPQGLPTAPFQPQINERDPGQGSENNPVQMPQQQVEIQIKQLSQTAPQPPGGYYLSTTQYQEMMQQYLQALLYQAMSQGNQQPAARGLSPASENGQVVYDDTDECADTLKQTKLAEGTRARATPTWLPNMMPQMPGLPQAFMQHPQNAMFEPPVLQENSFEERDGKEGTENENFPSSAETSPEKYASDSKIDGSNPNQVHSDSSDSVSNTKSNNRKERASELINKQMAEIDKEINRRSQNLNIKKIDHQDVEALLGENSQAAESLFQQYQQALGYQQAVQDWTQGVESAVPWSESAVPGQKPFEQPKDTRTLQEIQSQNVQYAEPGTSYPPQSSGSTSMTPHFPQAGMHPSAHAAVNALRQPPSMFNVQVPQQGPYPTYLPSEPEPVIRPLEPELRPPGLPLGQLPPAQAAEMLRQIQSGRIPEAFLQQQSKQAIRIQKSPTPPQSDWADNDTENHLTNENKSDVTQRNIENNQENGEKPVWQYRQSYIDQGKRNEISEEKKSNGTNNNHSSQNNEKHDSDTDNETDRLLGQGRFGRRRPQYQKAPTEDLDEPAKPVHKPVKKRNKEVFIHEPAVLIEGVLFRARYLGSTQIVSEGRPSKTTRMMQANEAVARIKAPEGEPQPSTEVDLFISTEKIMVLNTDLQRISDTDVRQDIMMDHPLRTISYIADIGDIVVLMTRRNTQGSPDSPEEPVIRKTPKILCHVFESDEAQFIAQSIAQAFQVAYLEFLRANGIEDPGYLRESDYQDVLNSQEIFGDELEMFANKEKQKDVVIPKAKDEILGLVIVESGWGSMLPAVMVANLKPGGSAARCNQLNIGDQIIAVNGISLVGLPLITCQTHVKKCSGLTAVKLTVVPTPPVVEVKIRRPDSKYQLGFSVQNGVICSLLRGGIAERGGIRVGHRIIEINEQSVVAVPHERIVNMLATAVGEIHMKTMPTSMFRLLTGQEAPNYI